MNKDDLQIIREFWFLLGGFTGMIIASAIIYFTSL